ncbi:NFACT RNA binding domain-containing protein [Schleiferilactobacillus harbinensis]|jgi:predicted ribosome quality control (RQC) complex YloA/Tae2 family protein|uniref:NFACT RNA binding domain-containing protein n=1 Tax=Schleiferilactobacillus harbinensis TaxID=304207 RepID=UPI00242B6424|nr:NFACT RNA binding domain-containing protein [Schleiferilactobacillus harbinensis]MCI1687156.1 NFACT family protein [Schleiferilactobacillus harbinensis]MCI1782535.1 NFACT family protein [Schleiferilactobacillus harbinensis]MCI1849935.1 NFACT family protein [Schleiferilactobacillus harbinensis]
MSFDGIFTRGMVNELNRTIVPGKITKIQQPYDNEIVLTIRANRKNHPLLLSAHPTYARIQVTDIPYVNPDVPTKFAMTLRKYLDGGVVTGISQVESDRQVHIHFRSRNELGDTQELLLIVELMGRHSNIMLVEKDGGKILDLIRHVSPEQNRYRLLMPGATYVAPPHEDRRDPLAAQADLSGLTRDLDRKTLQSTFQGLGADTASELVARLKDKPADQWDFIWSNFFAPITNDQPMPTIAETDQGKIIFTPFAYSLTTKPVAQAASLSALLDDYYRDKAQRDRVHGMASDLLRVVNNTLNKEKTKLGKQEKELAATEKADTYRVKGEVLTTYLHEVKRGMTEITLPNFYADNAPLKISLSNQLTPSRNAQKYFTRYQKLKNAVQFLNTQIKLAKEEIDYLENILSEIQLADPGDLGDIKTELTQQGYLREKKVRGRKKAKRTPLGKPEKFYASDGTQILVGKNNLQNDQLTLHKAAKTDHWLHVKNIPGSHVIVRSADPSDQTLTEAAEIAAYYSKARGSANVPVDTVEVKKIHKPNGAKPGFVIYEGQQTLYVTPKESDVLARRKKPETV